MFGPPPLPREHTLTQTDQTRPDQKREDQTRLHYLSSKYEPCAPISERIHDRPQFRASSSDARTSTIDEVPLRATPATWTRRLMPTKCRPSCPQEIPAALKRRFTSTHCRLDVSETATNLDETSAKCRLIPRVPHRTTANVDGYGGCRAEWKVWWYPYEHFRIWFSDITMLWPRRRGSAIASSASSRCIGGIDVRPTPGLEAPPISQSLF